MAREIPKFSLEIVEASKENVSFRIKEQDKTGEAFFPNGDTQILPSKITLASYNHPKLNGCTFYTRGSKCSSDNNILTCSHSMWDVIKNTPEEYAEVWRNHYKAIDLKALKESIKHWVEIVEYAHKKDKDYFSFFNMEKELNTSILSDHCALCKLEYGCSNCILFLKTNKTCKNNNWKWVSQSTSWKELTRRGIAFILELEAVALMLDPDYIPVKFSFEEKPKEKLSEPFIYSSKTKPEAKNPITNLLHNYTPKEIRTFLMEIETEKLITLATKVHGVIYKKLRREI